MTTISPRLNLITWLKMSYSILKQHRSPSSLVKLTCRSQKQFINQYQNNIVPAGLFCFIPLVKAADNPSDSDKQSQPFEPNDARLRSSECLKNAAGLSVDSTSAVLSQTVYAMINAEKQYAELLDALVQLMDYQVQVLEHEQEVQRIADIILEARDAINKLKKRRQDLALLFSSVEKLAEATAEVAFATGCTYASTSAGERLYSAQQEVKKVLAVSEKAEKEVARAEAQMIAQVSKYEEEVKKLKNCTEEVEDVDSDVAESERVENENIEEK